MDLILENQIGEQQAVITDFSLDMEYGIGTDNDFELTGFSERAEIGWFWAILGTEYGGVIDSIKTSHTSDGDSIVYTGRTWHGILSENVLMPPKGQSHLTVDKDIGLFINERLMEYALVGKFLCLSAHNSTTTPPNPVYAGYKFDRFVDFYSGLFEFATDYKKRIRMSYVSNDGFSVVDVEVEDSTNFGNLLGIQDVPFQAEKNGRPINHLTVLGKGELQDREVLQLYADEHGNISKTQTQFGVNHRGIVYELSNEESDKLLADGTKKLKEYQKNLQTAKANIPDGIDIKVGDTITATSTTFGIRTTATVTGMVVKIENGLVQLEPKTDGKVEITDY